MTSSVNTFTYWSLLGIAPGSDPDQLKKAFRKEARIWHPDLNQNDRNAEERFKWINQAYKVLSDPRMRFEWEVAGQPTFEIEEFSPPLPQKPIEKEGNKSGNKNSGFSSAEKLLLLSIAILSLLLSNKFIL